MAHRRIAQGTAGLVFHVVNRGVRKLRLFETKSDYAACLAVLAEAQDRIPLRLLAYCLMPNHFHLMVWPDQDGQLSKFMQWFTATHSKRWHAWRGSAGTGAVYQGRFKSSPVQANRHFYIACRYVEANALKSDMVKRAEDWPWSSLSQRCRNSDVIRLAGWPIPQPADWVELVNQVQLASETMRLRKAIVRGVAFGDPNWTGEVGAALKLKSGRRGRPPTARKDLGGLFT